MDKENAFAKKLTELRTERGLTQKQLADELHFTYQAVSNWERGVSSPDLQTVLSLAAFFGVSTDELLRGKPAERPKKTQPRAASEKLYTHSSSSPSNTAKALKILLYIYAVAVGGLIFLSFLSEVLHSITVLGAAVLGVFLIVFGIISAILSLAVPVLFLFAKEYSYNTAAKAAFIAGICVSAVASIVSLILLFSQNANAAATLVFSLLASAGSWAYIIAAPFAFLEISDKKQARAARKSYFTALIFDVVFSVFSVLTESSESLSLLIDAVSLAFPAWAYFCLFRCTADKTVTVFYRSARPPQEVWLPESEEKQPPAPIVTEQSAAIAAAESSRAFVPAGENAAPPAPPSVARVMKTVQAEQERFSPRVYNLCYLIYCILQALFFIVFENLNILVYPAFAVVSDLALYVLFLVIKKSFRTALDYLAAVIKAGAAAGTLICFYGYEIFHIPYTENLPLILSVPGFTLHFISMMYICFGFPWDCETKKGKLLSSLLIPALVLAADLGLFLLQFYTGAAQPSELLMLWANALLLFLISFLKEPRTKTVTAEIPVRKK